MRSPAELLRRRAGHGGPLDCDEAGRAIERQLGSGGRPSPELVAHVERCLRCQSELARHRKLLRLLAQLRHEVVPVPEGLVAGALAAVGEAAQRRAIRAALARQSLAYVGGVGAALAVLVVIGMARDKARPRAPRLRHFRQGALRGRC